MKRQLLPSRTVLFSAIWGLMIAMTYSSLSFAEVQTSVSKVQKSEPVFDRFLTIGFGVHSGYLYAGGSVQVEADSRLMYGFDVHVRLLKFLGFTASFDLNTAHSISTDKVIIPFPSLRLLGHLYIAQAGPMYLNILGGVGFNFTKENGGHPLSTYIVGSELGFKIKERFTIGATVRFLLPSYEQTMRAIRGEPSRFHFPMASQLGVDLRKFDVLERMFDFRNVQIDLTLRVFL